MKISAERFLQHERALQEAKARVESVHNRITGLRLEVADDRDAVRWQIECLRADLYFLSRRAS